MTHGIANLHAWLYMGLLRRQVCALAHKVWMPYKRQELNVDLHHPAAYPQQLRTISMQQPSQLATCTQLTGMQLLQYQCVQLQPDSTHKQPSVSQNGSAGRILTAHGGTITTMYVA